MQPLISLLMMHLHADLLQCRQICLRQKEPFLASTLPNIWTRPLLCKLTKSSFYIIKKRKSLEILERKNHINNYIFTGATFSPKQAILAHSVENEKRKVHELRCHTESHECRDAININDKNRTIYNYRNTLMYLLYDSIDSIARYIFVRWMNYSYSLQMIFRLIDPTLELFSIIIQKGLCFYIVRPPQHEYGTRF